MKEYGNLSRHKWAVPFEIAMLAGVIVTLAQGNWKHFGASLLTLVVSFLPLAVERHFRIKLPTLLQTLYVAFIFASLFAGEVLHMYGRIWVWDDVLHFISGLLVGLGAILWLVTLRWREKRLFMPVWFSALWVFCLTVSIAVLWEIIEFGSDELFGTFSQGADLFDTMMDITYGAVSGCIMATVWACYAVGRRIFMVSRIISHFTVLNGR